MPHVYDAEKERDCRENIHRWNQLLDIEFENVALAGNRHESCGYSDNAVQKVLSWLVNSVFFKLYLGVMDTLYWISFCLQPSAVIQFLECSYLFRLDNPIGMSWYKLRQYYHAMAIKETVETKPENRLCRIMFHGLDLCW